MWHPATQPRCPSKYRAISTRIRTYKSDNLLAWYVADCCRPKLCLYTVFRKAQYCWEKKIEKTKPNIRRLTEITVTRTREACILQYRYMRKCGKFLWNLISKCIASCNLPSPQSQPMRVWHTLWREYFIHLPDADIPSVCLLRRHNRIDRCGACTYYNV